MGMGFAPTWLRQVSPPSPASQNHCNHCTHTHWSSSESLSWAAIRAIVYVLCLAQKVTHN